LFGKADLEEKFFIDISNASLDDEKNLPLDFSKTFKNSEELVHQYGKEGKKKI
jgi:hypothetical protein